MHPEHKSYAVDLKKVYEVNKFAEFQQVMNEIAQAHNDYQDSVAKSLNISDACAGDVVYLRSRSRWTQELEDQLIEAHRHGQRVNVLEFGVTAQTQQALHESVQKQLLSEGYTSAQIRG